MSTINQEYLDALRKRPSTPGYNPAPIGLFLHSGLYEALDNLVIAIGMGWDLDGVVDVANEALAKARGEA